MLFIAKVLGLVEDDLELYGKYKAKVAFLVFDRMKDVLPAKLILVIASRRLRRGRGRLL